MQNLGGRFRTDKRKSCSIPDQFLQLLPRGVFAGIFIAWRREHPADEFEVFAEIADVFFHLRFRPPIATLMRRADIVARAVQADTQVGPALRTALAASRLPGQCPFPSAIPAVPRHAESVASPDRL